jgi:RNA polymerase sigma-70 factor (ECF subfamily)
MAKHHRESIEIEPSDESLVEAIRCGSDDSFTQLVRRHKRHVFRLGVHFVSSPDDLEELCQEVFLRVYERLKTFRHEAPFEHWLSRITVNTCYELLRKKRRDKGRLSLEQLPYELKDAGAESTAEARQAYETVHWGLSKLRPDERIVITLLEIEEKSVREVAGLTGWSEGNVRVRAHRARQAMKRILEGNDERR